VADAILTKEHKRLVEDTKEVLLLAIAANEPLELLPILVVEPLEVLLVALLGLEPEEGVLITTTATVADVLHHLTVVITLTEVVLLTLVRVAVLELVAYQDQVVVPEPAAYQDLAIRLSAVVAVLKEEKDKPNSMSHQL
jgi:hypothetical protein